MSTDSNISETPRPPAALVNGAPPNTIYSAPAPDAKPPGASDEPEGADDLKPEAAKIYLEKVARGEIPFDPVAGRVSQKISTYSYYLMVHMSKLLNMDRKEVLTLALCQFARDLTHDSVTAQNDLGVLTHGLQLSIQDLVLEMMQFGDLSLAATNQETVTAPSTRQL